MKTNVGNRSLQRGNLIYNVIILLIILLTLAALTFPAISTGPVYHAAGASVSNARQLGTILFTWASVHGFTYPDGASSTEVFQSLMDEGYLEPKAAEDLLYIPGMPGKVPYPGTGPLKPVHVCWDLVAPVKDNANDKLPLVVSTGWELIFLPGAPAEIRDKRLLDDPAAIKGLIIFRKGNSAEYIPQHEALNQPVMPEKMDLFRNYRQLRP